MAPLIILLVVFVLLYLINRLILKGKYSVSLIGRTALAVMLVVTGIAHFTNTEEMIQMLPIFLPCKAGIVYATGIVEFIAAAGLLTKGFSRLTAILLIVFFLAVLPANIVGSLKEVALGGMEKGVEYLYFRIPLQLFFIGWTYYFGIRTSDKSS